LTGAFETNAYPYAYTKKNIIDPTNMIATHCVFKTVLVCGFPAINLGINVTARHRPGEQSLKKAQRTIREYRYDSICFSLHLCTTHIDLQHDL
jgi:hypothetical protein